MADRVSVIGAGVIGLSCAVRLAEAGFAVDVLARELPPETTSAASAGIWLPSAVPEDGPGEGWARDTWAHFAALADVEASPGQDSAVVLRPGSIVTGAVEAGHQVTWPTRFADLVPVIADSTGRPGSVAYRFTTPVVDLPRYLDYLVERLRASGGTITRLALPALPGQGIVVNCTGIAAQALAADPSVRAVRGQSLLLTDPGLDRWLWVREERRLTCVVPRGGQVLVGATGQDDDWGTTADPAQARELLARAIAWVPALAAARVLRHQVGIRPVRPTIRVATERRPAPHDPGHAVVHCYGHGDLGVTVSWGCAAAVTEAVRRLVTEPTPVPG